MPKFSIAELKSKQVSLEQLSKDLAKSTSTGREKDDRYYYPATDKSGRGSAIIRFLPAPPQDGDDALPWVRWWDHGFKGPGGKWYIEMSRTTLNEPDPVSEANTELWNSGIESDKLIVRGTGPKNPGRKRRVHFASNILVLKDPANKENEGRIFLFKYGKKIFDKIQAMPNPDNEEREKLGLDPLVPCNVFDPWAGANFKFVITKVEGETNYDKSDFMPPTALFDGDEDKLNAMYNSLHSLKELISPDKFKSYDELKKLYLRVVGGSISAGASSAEDDDPTDGDDERPAARRPKTTVAGKTKPAPTAPAAEADDEPEEETMSRYAQLAEDDE